LKSYKDLKPHAKVMLCKEKTGISGIHTSPKSNSDGLYPNLRTTYRPRKSAELSDVSRPTINQLLLKLRTRIAQLCDASSPFSGEVEVDKLSFGGCVQGKKGREAGGKTIVFGIPERHGKIYTKIVPNAAKKSLQATIPGQVALSIIHSDGWRGYDGLVDRGYKKHFRVDHG